MADFSMRSKMPEIMDDLDCSGEYVAQTLKEISRVNHFLGGHRAAGGI